MLWIVALLLLYLAGQALYSGFYFVRRSQLVKKDFVKDFELGDPKNTVLKMYLGGDSIAAGVGATSFNTSIGGRLAEYLAQNHRVIFVNKSKGGSRMADMLTAPRPVSKQDVIILIVSSNDLFHFTPLKKFEETVIQVFREYSDQTDKLIVVGPGRVDSSRALPFPLRFIYKIRRPKYASILEKETRRFSNIVYIMPEGPTGQGNTFSRDKFHPNDEGYEVWFQGIKTAL